MSLYFKNSSVIKIVLGAFVLLLPGYSMSQDYDYVRLRSRGAPGEIDNALSFIYRSAPSASMEAQLPEWQAAAASELLWNDSYWPTYKGTIAYRYMDKSNVPKSKAWTDHYNYYLANPSNQFLGSSSARRTLSPAEKYDLLVGSGDWALTKQMWKKGADYLKNNNSNVPTWFGMCHGWAAASHMFMPLPLAPVEAVGVNGDSIWFSPTDIRALQTFLWAGNLPKSTWIGSKCNYGSLPTDPACLDNNPMSWHIALTHRIGRDGDSMVMDSSRGLEIWNYGVDSYYFRYFNPKTLKTFRHWKDAMVDANEFQNDSFKAKRASGTRYLVGVVMDVFFPSAIEPRENTSANRIYQSKNLVYDLEINESFNIIGGEWHTDDHPDFLWTFNYGVKAQTKEDALVADINAWGLDQPLPQEWASLANKASLHGDVMRAIVENLVNRSLAAAPVEDGSEDEEIE